MFVTYEAIALVAVGNQDEDCACLPTITPGRHWTPPLLTRWDDDCVSTLTGDEAFDVVRNFSVVPFCSFFNWMKGLNSAFSLRWCGLMLVVFVAVVNANGTSCAVIFFFFLCCSTLSNRLSPSKWRMASTIVSKFCLDVLVKSTRFLDVGEFGSSVIRSTSTFGSAFMAACNIGCNLAASNMGCNLGGTCNIQMTIVRWFQKVFLTRQR